MIIGIDFDDVLLDSYTSLTAFHNEIYGTNHTRDDVRSWLIEETWGCTSAEALKRVEEWYDSPWHAQTVPVSGAFAAVTMLVEHHDLRIITGRPGRVVKVTHELAHRHFPGVFEEIHFSSHFKANARSKGDVCQELGVSVMIEDAPTHAQAVAGAGVPVLLFDTPWNQGLAMDLVTRVFSWEDVLREIAAR